MFTDAIMLYGLIESKGGWKAKGKKLLVFEYFCTRHPDSMEERMNYENLCTVIRAIFGVEKEKLYPRNVVSKTKRKSVLLFIFIEKRSNKGYTYTES